MEQRTCSVEDCGRPHEARGWCQNHYALWRRNGEPKKLGRNNPPPEVRVWRNIAKTEDGCWRWLGTKTEDGYARIVIDGKRTGVHRFMYEQAFGPITPGLQIDHLCRVRDCVNPDHLEAVTCRENLMRGETFQARNAAKTHCPAGHPYDDFRRGARRCTRCMRHYQREYQRRKRSQT